MYVKGNKHQIVEYGPCVRILKVIFRFITPYKQKQNPPKTSFERRTLESTCFLLDSEKKVNQR